MQPVNEFSYLLAALLIFLVVLPVVDDLSVLSPDTVRVVGYSCLLLVGVWSLRGARKWFHIGLSLVVLGMVLNFLAFAFDDAGYLFAAIASLFAFLLLAIIHVMKIIWAGDELSSNRIVGAICVYLLLGTLWAFLYTVVELAAPGSFAGIGEFGVADWESDFVYFSFITLTTLGYGDITPVSGTARVLVYAQAVFGVFYIAVLVSSLVSIHLAANQGKD